MNKIKLIFTTLFLLATTSSLSAQSYDISSLTGKTWKAVSGYNYSDKVNMNVVFTNTDYQRNVTQIKESQRLFFNSLKS